MKIKNLLILSMLILNFASLRAFIVNLQALDNQSQIVIEAGDAHFGCQKNSDHPSLSNLEIKCLNKADALSLVNFAKQFPKEQSLFILEDMYYPQGKDGFTDNFFVNLRQKNEDSNFSNCMSYINDFMKNEDLKTENIEFRHAVFLYAKGHTLTSQFVDSIFYVMNEIQNYNDNPIANQYYKDLVDSILTNNKELLDLLNNNSTANIDQIEALFGKEPFRSNFNNFVFDYYLLIDAKIIHTILQHSDKKYIFICAGNNHLERMNIVLKALDYNEKYNSNNADIPNPINVTTSLSKLALINPEIEFPYISIFIALLFVLSVRYPTRFRIIHFHTLNLNSKVGA
ncbi:MAG: hypothetical protein P4L22_07240 [Candidatus Babeliales bacterium]|nr:hypothetical protein [Candidatus Babeliales bacterium]